MSRSLSLGGETDDVAAAGGWRCERGRQIGLQPLRRKRCAHHIDFPTGDKTVRGMLQLASAAGFEMAAGRGNAVGRRCKNADIAQLLAILRSGNHLTGKGERRIKRALGNAVAVMAKPCDGKFTHAPRLAVFLLRRKC